MSALKAKQMDVVMGIVSERDVFTNSNYEIWEKSVLWSPALHEALFIFSITSSRYRVATAKIQRRFSIIIAIAAYAHTAHHIYAIIAQFGNSNGTCH